MKRPLVETRNEYRNAILAIQRLCPVMPNKLVEKIMLYRFGDMNVSYIAIDNIFTYLYQDIVPNYRPLLEFREFNFTSFEGSSVRFIPVTKFESGNFKAMVYKVEFQNQLLDADSAARLFFQTYGCQP